MEKLPNAIIWIGIILILATGFIHAIETEDAFEEVAYKGWLFYANGLASLFAAVGIFKKMRLGWTIGFL